MRVHRFFVGSICFSVFLAMMLPLQTIAGSLQLSGQKHWLTVASTQDIDSAIAIARFYASENGKVVSSKSGWFAVVLGPYAQGSVAAVVRANSDIGDIPRDARLSRGESYVEIVWQKPIGLVSVLTNYSTLKAAQFVRDEINFQVGMSGDEDSPGPTVATAQQSGTELFSFETSAEFSVMEANAAHLNLDPNSPTGQLVFTRFTGGAHCCTQTWVATNPHGAQTWELLELAMLDSEGYWFEDIDGDGALELLSVDNRFLYAFESYAGSFAPIRIEQVRGGKLLDVGKAQAFAAAIRQDLAAMEFSAKLNPDLWRSNGFLAAWVAAKMRLGQGDVAWAMAESNLDPNSDFGPQICKLNIALDECPAEELQKMPIAQALAQFLAESDYGPLPQAARALLP